jgi:hypothetical protein
MLKEELTPSGGYHEKTAACAVGVIDFISRILS